VLKENSKEIECLVWGKGELPLPDLPMEELPWWEAVRSRDPQHTDDWDTEERYPRFKEWAKKIGLGSGLRVPLTTPHRRLGVFGINRDTVNPFSEEEISFLELIGRVVAFALDDGLNLKRAQHQNDQLQLLLDLTNRITSNLQPRDLLRAIAANIREVIHADAVTVVLPDAASEKFRVLAMDFPHGKGIVKEELLVTPSAAVKKALNTLKPVVINTWEPNQLSSEASDLVAAEGIKTFCNIPLVNRGRALGILSILRTTDTPFSPGDVDFLSRASGQIAIAIENALAYHEISQLKDKLAQEKLYLEEEIRSEMNFENIIGNTPALKHVLELVETVAPSDSTVLLLGETGTGKELIARAVHDRSRRKDRTFVKLNCAAIPTGLLESELFGHEKGAFTGAIAQKIGRMELADQGTLFLDEVGDIPVEIQPKLLRAIQEREFERLGSIHTRRVNIRLVAATNRDLEKMIVVALPFSSLQLNPSLVEYLNLSQSQVEAIQQMMLQEQQNLQPVMTELRTTRAKLLAVSSEHINEKEVKGLADKEANVLAKLIVANARMQSKIYKLLSPGQQKKLNDLERAQGTATMDVR
jgi:formate hydrogenlyase transcriptional activator